MAVVIDEVDKIIQFSLAFFDTAFDYLIEIGKVKYLTYGQGYPYIIAAKLQASLPEMKYRFSNHGISGNNLYDILARWNWDTMALKPDYISLLIGVNDIWQSHDRNEILKFNYTSFELTYLSMIELARKQLPNTKLILCEPFILQGEHTTSRFV